jgi:hypothetical protein
MYGFHGCVRISQPIDRISSPQATSVRSMAAVPPRRRAMAAMAAIDPALIASAPSSSPTGEPPASR